VAVVEPVVADTSVFTRIQRPAVDAAVSRALIGRLLHTCAVVRLEVMRGMQSRARWRIAAENLRALPDVAITHDTWDRAEAVQALLATSSHHTSVAVPDLLVAAAAEEAGLPVVHYDRDFDLIAEVTGQDCRWIVPRGSVD
jgi:predicted nucleic acid-binding protein